MTDGNDNPSGPNNPTLVTQSRVNEFEKLVESCVEGHLSLQELVEKLQSAGATPSEAQDYINQAEQALAALTQSAPNRRSATPDGLTDEALRTFRQERDERRKAAEQALDEARHQAADTVAWKLLQARVAHAQCNATVF